MGWRSIIITQHAKLSYSLNMMVVQTNDGINQVPLDDIELLLVSTTQAVVTTSLLNQLAQREVKVLFVDGAREPIAELNPLYPEQRCPSSINEQLFWEEDRKEILWTHITANKIKNQIQVLKQNEIGTQDLEAELLKLEKNDFTNREAVVARKYFPLLFEKGFSRHKDSSINAALNYGYAILLSLVDQTIVSRGYMTYWGIHHSSEENRYNLGSDLMEPFRPFVDAWVAVQKFTELTSDVKYGLVDLLNLEIRYKKKNTLLRTAIKKYVGDCLEYLGGRKKDFDSEVELKDEVSHHALNDNV